MAGSDGGVRAQIAIGVMSALLIWRHKDNIKRLMAGQESRIGSKKKNAAGA